MKRKAEEISSGSEGVPPPTNSLVSPLLTDMYQISMAYALWNHGRAEHEAVFELFFRKAPFSGEFCIFAGQDEIIKFISNYRFSDSDIDYLRTQLPHCDSNFFDWLASLDCSKVKLLAIEDGSVVFPREPLIRVEGPMAVVQLLETTLLNLINFPSLIATNAARMRIAAGEQKQLLEFGLRRAQGPDGGMSASKYAYLGGFDGTSNVQAGKFFDITINGTHAHSFVMSYTGLCDLTSRSTIKCPDDDTREVEFVQLVLDKRDKLRHILKFEGNEGELAAFIAYAQSFPKGFLALVDTYDTLQSGVPNFLTVAWALHEVGYQPRGIRLDSGDLAYLSKAARRMFRKFDEQVFGGGSSSGNGSSNGKVAKVFESLAIVASNDINEDVLISLAKEGHEIDKFGIGTHLVTCNKQPALGCVFKLVSINDQPRMKLSQDITKVVIPGKKQVYRLYGKDGNPLLDIMQQENEEPPTAGKRLLARDPFNESKRVYVTPVLVRVLLQPIFDGADLSVAQRSTKRQLEESRSFCIEELKSLRPDHLRAVNPTPYKISVSEELYHLLHKLWHEEAPIQDLS